MSEFIIDSTAFYSGMPFLTHSSVFYTTSKVYDEIRHIKKKFSILENLIEIGKIRITDPETTYVDKIMAIARQYGESSRLSPADISILALALQIRKSIISDDYSVINIASALSLPIASLVYSQFKGIRKWSKLCKTCNKLYSYNVTSCDLCGNKLKIKYKTYNNQK